MSYYNRLHRSHNTKINVPNIRAKLQQSRTARTQQVNNLNISHSSTESALPSLLLLQNLHSRVDKL